MQQVQNEGPTPFVVRLKGEHPSTGQEPGLVDHAFSRHFQLRDAVPGEGVEMHFLSIQEGETTLRSHDKPCLLIILRGKAELIGDSVRTIERGDVVTLPKNHEYGFRHIDGTSAGLDVLQVLFQEGAHEQKQLRSQCASLEDLLAKNEEIAARVLSNPFFTMFRDGRMWSDEVRGIFRDRLRVFSDAFQTFLFARQATCSDEMFRATFAEHLVEEAGHNNLMYVTGEKRRFDAILEATSNWFPAQMLVKDNAGKAVIHLALETGGDYFHTLAQPSFQSDVSAEYFRRHAEDDERHKEMSYDLLRDLTPEKYAELEETLIDTWSMIDAMTRRIQHLVAFESKSS